MGFREKPGDLSLELYLLCMGDKLSMVFNDFTGIVSIFCLLLWSLFAFLIVLSYELGQPESCSRFKNKDFAYF